MTNTSKLIAVFALAVSAATSALAQAPSELRIEHDEDTFAIFVAGIEEALVTQHARASDRPYIHPIVAPDGNGILTQYRPEHHPHQTGLYWGLKKVNGRDYFMQWRDEYYRRVSAKVIRERGTEVSWQTVYELLGADGKPILAETQIWSMQHRDGTIVLDLEWRGEALADVRVEQFYVGGLFLRMPWHAGIGGDIVNASGRRNGDAEGQRAVWTDVGMEIEGRADQAHIAMFDHPDNEGFPTAWRVDGELGVGPSRQIRSDWKLEKGERTSTRYRLLVYTGERDLGELTRKWTEYAGSDGAPGDRLNNYRDWGIYRGDKTGIQYSELSQITTENVHLLEPAWEYRHGDPNGPGMYSNPIVVDGLMYFTTPKVNAVALDAATGEEVWVFEHADYDEDDREFRGRNRGVAYWEDAEGGHGRIFNFVKDRVYAIDAASGALIESFGEGGFIDLRKNLPVDPATASIEVTTPGIVYRDFLIVGSRVPEENETTPGDVRAYDALTGEFRWIFHTVPLEGEPGHDTWEWHEGMTYGGANPWGGFTIDEERGWVFFATGSAAGDFIYGGARKGENLFSSTVLALDAATGERKWHYQTIHHDIFDYDNPPAPILATITGDGKKRDVAVQLTKMGFTFVLDRETGEPVFPVVELPVPPSTVPGEEAWPTQPFPLKPPPLVRQGMYESDVTNISPEAHAAALAEFRKYKTGPLYTPASREGTITLPGHQGGMEWGGAAFDPATNVMYINANEAPTINRLEPLVDESTATTSVARGRWIYNANCTSCHGLNRMGNPPLYPPLTDIQLGTGEIRNVLRQGRGIMPAFGHLSEEQVDDVVAYLESDAGAEPPPEVGAKAPGSIPQYANIAPFFVDPDGYPAISPPWGTLNAVDLDKGEILWKVPLGEYPELAAKGIRNTGAKNFGGPVLTAGGIVFIAATPDEKIRAFDKRSGAILWEHKLPAGGYATPSVYMIDRTQYVVIAAGGGGKLGTKHGDSIVAFALPESARSGVK